MNILFIKRTPFPGAGGVGRVTETLAKEFKRQGIKVFYVALSKGINFEKDGIVQYFAPRNKVVCRQNISFLRDFISINEINIIINQSALKTNIVRVVKAANNGRAKVFAVHHNCVQCLIENYEHIIKENYKSSKFSWLITSTPFLKILKKYGKIKLIAIFHKAIKASDMLVLLSDRFVPELKMLLKKNPNGKVIGIPNPAPFKPISNIEGSKENRLLFVGRVNNQQKRVDLVLDIWSNLFEKFPDWYLDIVGDGPDLNDLKQKSKQLGLERIFFYGYCDPKPFYKTAKIFLMTSAFEGYGMVLVEAQAYGTIPFAFNTFSALKDIIESGVSGYIYEPFNISEYTNGLSDLMNDEAQRQKMAIAAQNSVGAYDIKIIANQWLKLFKEILDAK